MVIRSGKIVQKELGYAYDMVRSGRAVIVSGNPLTVALCIDHPDEMRRQQGRRIEGVTRPVFCGRSTASNPARRMFPPREEPR